MERSRLLVRLLDGVSPLLGRAWQVQLRVSRYWKGSSCCFRRKADAGEHDGCSAAPPRKPFCDCSLGVPKSYKRSAPVCSQESCRKAEKRRREGQCCSETNVTRTRTIVSKMPHNLKQTTRTDSLLRMLSPTDSQPSSWLLFRPSNLFRHFLSAG